MKRLLTVVILITTVISCAEKNETKNTAKNQEKLIKQYFEYFNNHQWEKMANMYADTADFKDPSLGQGIVKQTRQQTIQKYTELNKIFADLHDEIIETYVSGDNQIIVEFISSGTGPDKVKFQLPICTIFKIENGLISKDFTYYDNFEEPKKN